jgi:hypothetical protein
VTEDQYFATIMETLFSRGLTWDQEKGQKAIAIYAENYRQSGEPSTTLAACIEMLNRIPNLLRPAKVTKDGISCSTTGACGEWIAVHEAAHAIVAVKAGTRVWGIRFYGDGSIGETGIEQFNWRESTDEDLLGILVRVDVAGNVGELMRSHDPSSRGGRLSRFFPEDGPQKDGDYPYDAVNAWDHAKCLALVRFQKAGKEPSDAELRSAIYAIIAQAESEAEQVLLANSEALDGLAGELLRGPMTGTAIRAIKAQ